MAWINPSQGTYGSRAESIKRQLAYADALRKKGLDMSPEGTTVRGGSGPLGALPDIYVPPSFADYAAPALQAGIGGYFAGNAEQDQADNEARAAKEASEFVLPSSMKTLKKQIVTPGEDVPVPQAAPTQVPTSPFGTTEAGSVMPGTALPGAMAQFRPGADVTTTTEEQVMKSIPEYADELAAAGQAIDPTNPFMAPQREAILKQTMRLPEFALEQQAKHEDAMAALDVKVAEDSRQEKFRHEEAMARITDAQQRTQETIAHNQQMENIQKQANEDRARLQSESIAARREATAAASSGKIGVEDARKWTAEDRMSAAFRKEIANTEEELVATGKIKQIAPSMTGRRPDAVEQQTLAILINKFLDPGSVVREGEFNRVALAQGLYDKVANLREKIMKGEMMSNELIKNIVAMSDLYEKAALSKMQKVGDIHYNKAKSRGLDPEAVVISPYYKPSTSSSTNAEDEALVNKYLNKGKNP
jgi:hypothetical protein